jgi:hypothetical protein
MRKKSILILFSAFILSFNILKEKKDTANFMIAYLEDIYIDKGDRENHNGEKVINIFIGIFPKVNDTVTIYKLNNDQKEKPEIFSFWSKKINNHSITFYCAEQDDVKVTFANQNNIIVNNDTYTVNNEYYLFLKQKIYKEQSILDLAFFLKDGYGDYAQTLEPLNKNWQNQKENNTFKIIKAEIKNRNFQTDDQFFNYKISCDYSEEGLLQIVSGENSFNKKLIKQNNKYLIYTINRLINERASDIEYLYKNKKTLFDSIIGNRESFSNATIYYYTKYQSKLKFMNVGKKPKNFNEILKILILKKKELN